MPNPHNSIHRTSLQLPPHSPSADRTSTRYIPSKRQPSPPDHHPHITTTFTTPLAHPSDNPPPYPPPRSSSLPDHPCKPPQPSHAYLYHQQAVAAAAHNNTGRPASAAPHPRSHLRVWAIVDRCCQPTAVVSNMMRIYHRLRVRERCRRDIRGSGIRAVLDIGILRVGVLGVRGVRGVGRGNGRGLR
jgi:hypothetical protein